MSEHVRYWTPEWQPAREPDGAAPAAPSGGGRVLLLATDEAVERAVRAALAAREPGTTLDVVRSADRLPAALRDGGPPDRLLLWRAAGADESAGGGVAAAEAAEREYFLLHDLTRELLASRPAHEIRLLHVAEAGPAGPRPEHAAVAAFAGVVQLEKPTFHFRSVLLSPRPVEEAVATALAEFDRRDPAVAVRHDGAQRAVRGLRALPAPAPGAGPAVRAGGTYLITGGLGDLGLVFARELARRAAVRLVLTGRRPLGAPGRAAVDELTAAGAQVRYLAADVATPDGVATLLRETRSAFGPLTGVLHSAGVLRDSFLLKKTHEEAAAVLAAKVRGARLLDEALAGEPLDFFALFSSLAGTIGNLGQADYGFANAYLDAFARERDELRRRGLRAGRSLAVGWPLWGESAAREAAEGSADRARTELGLHPLTGAEGVAAFFDALACEVPQVLVVKGEERTWRLLGGAPEPAAAPAGAGQPADGSADGAVDPILRTRTREYLVRLVSRFTKLPTHEIRTDASFGRYGVESIMIIGMTQDLENELGPLAKTLFFEYDSVDELAEHLVTAKGVQLRAVLGLEAPAPSPAAEPAAEAPAAAAPEAAAGQPARTAGSGKWALLQARSRAATPGGAPAAAAPAAPAAPAPAVDRPAAPAADERDIAVIGLAGRYPHAANPDAFWENLRQGVDSVTEVPARRWDPAPFFDPEKGRPGTSYSRWGGFLDGIEHFDPLFFGISPAEAEFLDPQERLFLETSWQAVEDAGYAPQTLAGRKVGVFAGVMFGLYQLLATEKHGGWLNGNSSYASVANRVSYFFDFHGPSMTVDTMCSSSLVAVHQAVAAIRSGACELALAGGVNVMSHPAKYVQLSQGGFLSTDGRCRAFGEGGDGYVPGEGVGALLLKPLARALADGDHIHAVIKGSAVNAGGRTSGYSVPNPAAQAEVIGDALADARVEARDVSYVEAHGTGTALGDPIEITGLTRAYRRTTGDSGFCAIGSVKSNIGHLESAAGIAALTKVILQLRHRQLAPSLHTATLNPLIDFTGTPFVVQRQLADWAAPVAPDGRELPRRAAVSAFGAGGTNAHLVLEEAPPPTPSAAPPAERLIVLSARDAAGLTGVVRRLLDRIDPAPAPAPAPADAAEPLTEERVRTETRAAVAAALGLRPSDVDDDESYPDQGLGAFELATCHERLRDRLGLAFPVEALYERPTVEETTAYLLALGTPGGAPAPAVEAPAAAPEVSLADLAYTLQTGREAMAERLAVRAASLDELRQRLRAHLAGDRTAAGVWHGSAEDHDRRVHSLLRHDVTQRYTRELLAEGRLDEAAEMWVMGAEVDWPAAWEHTGSRRLPLPTYPFARETHWIVPVGPDDPLVPAWALPAPLAGQATPAAAPAAPAIPAAPPAAPAVEDPRDVRELVLADLKQSFSEVLQIPVDRLRPRTSFEDYGMDSIRITQLNRVLERRYGTLPTSLLFTYKDLESLTDHLASTRGEQLRADLAAPVAPAASVPAPGPVVAPRGGSDVGDVGDIAIIGLSGRYPRAASLTQFAANLADGLDSISEIPADRWDHREFPDLACKWGGFLDDAFAFDPAFFNLSPGAAAYMDPQERLFLQAVWHALEDAGYRPEALADPNAGDRRANVAVYAGVTFNEYGLHGAAELAAGKDVPIDSQLYSVANRVSYLLNLRGPSLVVDTACSSSLYAIHLACEALRHGEAETAIAGGVNLSLHPSKYLTLGMFNFLAPDGHCKSFGEGGNGYVPGEGVGALFLKPLRQAEADGDHIHGVIKGTAVNHGGKTNGYTVPNPVAQAEVVRAALARAGVAPGDISYVEAHGTGTSLGDTIEVEALSAAFDGFPDDGRHVAIGSVKSNIGHLEAAAGVSQVTKVLLQMREGRLFPSRLNSERLNPEIDFERTPFRVQLVNEPWRPAAGQPRRAGVSSFGVGGVNAHLVLEEYVAPERPATEQAGPWLVPLSARDPQALGRVAATLLSYLEGEAAAAPPALADLAFTLQTGRRALRARTAFLVADHAELLARLRAFVADGGTTGPLDEAGERFVAGDDVDFDARWAGLGARRVPLPGYPFERDTYWLYESPLRAVAAAPAAAEAGGGPAGPATAAAEPDGVDREFLDQLADAFHKDRPALVTGYLQRRIAVLLGFAEGKLPETDRGFFELGMDSITSTQTHSLLERLLGLELDLQLFFNYPSIDEVAAYVLDLLDRPADAAGPAADADVPTGAEAPVWLFTRGWSPADQDADQAVAGGTVLLLDTGDRLRAALTAQPADRRPARVVLVRPGERGLRAAGTDEFTLDPTHREDYEALLATLAERDVTVDRIIHHWSATESDPAPERIEHALRQGVYALTALSQAVLARLAGQRVRLLSVARHPDGAAAPENRGLGGFVRAARMESPSFVYKTVEFTDAEVDEAGLAEALLAEFERPEQDVELAYAGGRRLTRSFAPVPAGEIETAAPRFRDGGVYLVTGGPGGLAGLFARYLCREHRATVVLVGRREATEERLAELAELSVGGAEAVYLRADIGDRKAVTDLVAEVRARYGRITGVLHSAGALRDSAIQHKRPEEMAEVFQAKVFGTRHLDEALRDEPLECFVLFSSLAAVLGNFGQSDYCYANGYLDAFAEYRERLRERGERFGHTLSVNWSFWRSGGMETSEAVLRWMRERLGTVVLEGPEGWSALRAAAGLDHPHVVSIKGDIEKITSLLAVPEDAVAGTLPIGPETEFGRAAEVTEAAVATEAGAEALVEGVEEVPSDIDAMGEDELVALLRKEIELSENEGLMSHE
ncbi:SDR family NAD(P)-dependent oxidoreductase [Streptomyces sp. DSM 44915]|uniref:SDR family NAD(P)-dependent oxidoreductase n=1 Tax=Streptomyces chisholmiae TaxID=3075540 RepID=A0ABU2JTM5_9ACTN|nr:SDR family NAD(P)-dependent oxidoreductase [Streptomyces sp. DSM 44915]MDT0268347.1 SDR family NAD(P)-dependent oxidoreductase [Streptomyces sp. DSM 44915]UZD11009.1 polyketide synthase [Marinispora sp. CNQ-140]